MSNMKSLDLENKAENIFLTKIESKLKDKRKTIFMQVLKKYAILFILLVFIAILATLSRGRFLELNNLVNIVVQVTPIGIVALAMMLPIITKGIDLSVGSIVAVAAVISASLAQKSSEPLAMYPGLVLPIFVSIVAGLFTGAGTGALNGFFVAKFGIAPFIATLGMMTAARGAAYLYTDSRPVSGLASGFNFMGQGTILGIPTPVWIFLVVIVIFWFLLNKTRFGRHVYAIGGNEQAARVSGINVESARFWIYTISGTAAGLAGIILAARIGSGNPTLGTQLELDAITAAVIGGTSFNGGVGTVWGTVVGTLIIGVINTGLDYMNVSPYMQLVVKGAIIVLAIIIDERKNR